MRLPAGSSPSASLPRARGDPASTARGAWQARDGSRSSARWSRRSSADDEAIPWLLLHTRTTGGAGRLAGITSVQRIHTRGGTTPARTCDEATLGRTERVPYTADYIFFEGGHS